MEHFFRIRALVDSDRTTAFCLASNVDAALDEFEKLINQDTGESFGTYGIDVAMVHRITFGEAGPVFEDVTYQLSNKWARTTFEQALGFYPEGVLARIPEDIRYATE